MVLREIFGNLAINIELSSKVTINVSLQSI